MEAFEAIGFILFVVLVASPLSDGTKITILIVIAAIMIAVLIAMLQKKRHEKQMIIHEERKIALENLHRIKQELKTGAKETITYELGHSDRANCPYCGSLFKVNANACPHCGAAINKVGDKLTITKVSEGGDILMALDNRHKERMAQIKTEKQIKLREKYAEFGVVLLALFGFMAFIVTIVIITTK